MRYSSHCNVQHKNLCMIIGVCNFYMLLSKNLSDFLELTYILRGNTKIKRLCVHCKKMMVSRLNL